MIRIRSLLRRAGIGSKWLRFRRALDFGLSVELSTFAAKHRYLRAVQSFPQLKSGDGPVDCLMLLNEQRIWEGLWSLYSFRNYFGRCRLIVLNDGTLKRESIDMLEGIFPGILVPDFQANNNALDRYLAKRRLLHSREWRKQFVFFRKLVDSLSLARTPGFILLDSDCLHFNPPHEINRWVENPVQFRYIADIKRHSFCAPAAELSRICRSALPEYFCAGYLCVPAAAVDLDRVENYLSEDCFAHQLSKRQFAHVSEQTLYAMEAAIVGAEMLPRKYATCPDLDREKVTMGHFCGGSYQRTWFYTKGLPVLNREFHPVAIPTQFETGRFC